MLILACINVYVCVLTCMCMYPYVYACISFSVLHKTQKGKGGTGQDLVPSNVRSKRESTGSKTACKNLGLEHTSTQWYVVVCPTEPTVALTLWQVCGYIYHCQRYIHIQTIHTYTYIYIQIYAYTCIYRHIHACANHGREGSLGGCGRRSMSQEVI
jgi:hypothetical protein